MEDTTRRTDWTIVISYYLIWLGSSLLAGKTAYLSSYTMAGLDTIMLIAIFWRSKELKRPIDINLLKGIGWGLIAWGAVLLVMLGIKALTNNTVGSSNTGLILHMMRKQWLYTIYIVIVAPLLEEIVFRQCLYRRIDTWMTKHWPGMLPKAQFIAAALVVALFFAAMHGDTSLWEYVLISLVLQGLYQRYGDLRVSMTAHLVFNLTTLIVLTCL
ncbi:CPBP family intramembrane glutamic endopeptidase [Limosilactobacillus mucosae]|uniref:CPBP family intramembrane glutamic endopeptidase n=1 Tax=Limosilactobacillus mucosae TaxID=97478 RepID=UPI003EB6D318